jgi:hypothetical protein
VNIIQPNFPWKNLLILDIEKMSENLFSSRQKRQKSKNKNKHPSSPKYKTKPNQKNK